MVSSFTFLGMRRLQVTHVLCHQQMLPLTPDCHGAELVQDSGRWIGRQQRGMLRAFGGVELCKSKWMRGYNPIQANSQGQICYNFLHSQMVAKDSLLLCVTTYCAMWCNYYVSIGSVKLWWWSSSWGLATSCGAGKTTQVQAIANQLLTMDMIAY